MYYCNNCKDEFEEPARERTTFEDFYGVSHLFNTSHDFDLLKCPNCGSDDIEEMATCDICGEYCLDNDLVDTEELIGGGVGYCCPQCVIDCGIGGE